MLSLCFYPHKARKSRPNGFRNKTEYVWALDYRWRSFAIDDRRLRGRATYAALAREEKLTKEVHDTDITWFDYDNDHIYFMRTQCTLLILLIAMLLIEDTGERPHCHSDRK